MTYKNLNKFDWNRISEEEIKFLSNKKLLFIAGPIQTSKKRIIKITKQNPDYTPLLGVLKDIEIPGLEGSDQFLPLKYDLVKKEFKNLNINVIKHFYKDIKYIIRELSPQKVIFINGSWKGQIHYTSQYWEAVNKGIPVELVSPFVSEFEAKNYCKKISSQNEKKAKKIVSEKDKYSDTELIKIAERISRFSWDWIGQVSALLVLNGKVIEFAWNKVLPFESFQLHFGSIREKIFTPAQEMLETQLTNHDAIELIEKARIKNISLKDKIMYTNIFPCPVCAKMLSRTDIKGIVYKDDHNLSNDFGYKVLKLSGKIIRRIV